MSTLTNEDMNRVDFLTRPMKRMFYIAHLVVFHIVSGGLVYLASYDAYSSTRGSMPTSVVITMLLFMLLMFYIASRRLKDAGAGKKTTIVLFAASIIVPFFVLALWYGLMFWPSKKAKVDLIVYNY